jgi:8-oxo-dGTP diphosphatase
VTGPGPVLPGFLGSLAPLLDHYGYLAVGALVLVEDFGIPAPGETVLVAAAIYADESVLDAATREADEEVGVLIDPADLRHVHTLHVNGSGPEPRLGVFFETRRWANRPTANRPIAPPSPGPLDALPEELIDYPAAGIAAYRGEIPFSIHGWTPQPIPAGTPC